MRTVREACPPWIVDLLATVLLVAVAVLGCDNTIGPAMPDDLVPYDWRVPESVPVPDSPNAYFVTAGYQQWWDSMETCSGYRRDIGEVEFFYWPGPRLPDVGEGTDAVGLYDRARSSIWLVEWGVSWNRLVMHEMLHALSPSAGHGPQFDRCDVRMGM